MRADNPDFETPAAVLAFWRAAGPDRWFGKDEGFDAETRARFLATHEAAASGVLRSWEDTPDGALALVVVLDQFPRNIFRGTPRAFATDPLARVVADRAIARGFDQRVPDCGRAERRGCNRQENLHRCLGAAQPSLPSIEVPSRPIAE